MNRLLYWGCTPGEDVRVLQNDLNAVTALPSQKSGLAPLEADGAFGSKTRARVIEFQSLNGLKTDGVVGPGSSGALAALLEEIPGAQATAATGGAAPGSGKGYSGGPPFGKPIPTGGEDKELDYGGKSSVGGGTGVKGYGGKGYGGKDYGGTGGKGW